MVKCRNKTGLIKVHLERKHMKELQIGKVSIFLFLVLMR